MAGEAKRRGTPEQRKAAAIAAGREKRQPEPAPVGRNEYFDEFAEPPGRRRVALFDDTRPSVDPAADAALMAAMLPVLMMAARRRGRPR